MVSELSKNQVKNKLSFDLSTRVDFYSDPYTANPLQKTSAEIVEFIRGILDDGKMIDIKCYKNTGDYVVDYSIVCSGTSGKHASGIAGRVKKDLKKELKIVPLLDDASPDWVVLDVGFVIVHLLTQPKRDFYDMDNLLLGYGNKLLD